MLIPDRDLDRIMAIMDAAFDPLYGEAWSRRQVADAMLIGNCRYHLIGADGNAVEDEETAAGFFMARRSIDEEELLLIGVAPDYRRKGLATLLLEYLLETARAAGAQRVVLEMRQGNDAEHLYAAFGFQAVGIRPKYYRKLDGPRLDAITFALSLSETERKSTDTKQAY